MVHLPPNWAFSSNQTILLHKIQPCFRLLGTTYGGNGQTTLPYPI
ncbi:MAG: tail fiber protein [Chitinophagaceae bacterium]|nr:tail fiber protein [Chitinophagaceae bacterium]